MKMRTLTCVVALSFACTASATWTTGFEAPDYNGAPGGTVLTGQQNWYLPVVDSTDFNVHTYAGNSYGFVDNPKGGQQFIIGRSAGNPGYARAQHDYAWGSSGVYELYYDVAVKFDGTLPATHYLGSFSQQDSATNRYWQSLHVWDDLNTADKWSCNYVSPANPIPGAAPGPAWQGLQLNHWYRMGTKFDMGAGTILEVSIEDLHTNVKTTVQPQGWTFNNPSFPDPTALRFFTGGSLPGAIQGFDNLQVIPEPASLLMLTICVLLRRR